MISGGGQFTNTLRVGILKDLGEAVCRNGMGLNCFPVLIGYLDRMGLDAKPLFRLLQLSIGDLLEIVRIVLRVILLDGGKPLIGNEEGLSLKRGVLLGLVQLGHHLANIGGVLLLSDGVYFEVLRRQVLLTSIVAQGLHGIGEPGIHRLHGRTRRELESTLGLSQPGRLGFRRDGLPTDDVALGIPNRLAPGLASRLPHLLASDGIDGTTILVRTGLAIRNVDRALGSRDQGRSTSCLTTIIHTLILLLELLDAIVLVGLLVIELVLLGIDDHHGMTDRTFNVLRIGTLDGHIGDQVRDLTHLHLLALLGNQTGIVGLDVLGQSVPLRRIKILQTVQRRRMLDLSFVVRNDQHGITIEVRTRQNLGDMMVDTDGILRFAGQVLQAFLVAIVHHEFWHLEGAGVRESNQDDLLAVIIVWSEDLVILQRIDRKDDVGLLPRHVGGFQRHSVGITLVGEFLKQLFLDYGVGKMTDLVILQPGSIKSNAQLLLRQLGALLRQHLRWQVTRPSFPIAFLTQDVDGRMLLLASGRIDVVGLLGDGTFERVGLIDDRNAVLHLGLRRLEHIHLGSAAMLVGAEGQVGTLRKVIRVTIHGHALEVVIAVDENAHLGIMHARRQT